MLRRFVPRMVALLSVVLAVQAQTPDASIVDQINRSLQQEVERTAKSVEVQKPVVAPKPVELLPADWLVKISQDYTLMREANQPLPLERITWYVQHQRLLQQQLTQSRTFLFSLTQQLKAQGLPTELGLVPLLTQGASTTLNKSALGVLKRLQPTLKDPLWLLAVYASSEQAVLSMQKAHPGVGFWQLPWPTRTAVYVANLVALAQLIKNADYYGLSETQAPPKVPPALLPREFQPLPGESTPSLPDIMQKIYPSQ